MTFIIEFVSLSITKSCSIRLLFFFFIGSKIQNFILFTTVKLLFLLLTHIGRKERSGLRPTVWHLLLWRFQCATLWIITNVFPKHRCLGFHVSRHDSKGFVTCCVSIPILQFNLTLMPLIYSFLAISKAFSKYSSLPSLTA